MHYAQGQEFKLLADLNAENLPDEFEFSLSGSTGMVYARDEILKKPEEAVRMDPIDENMSVMYGKPIKAFVDQDHDSHVTVHMQFLQDPSLGGNPGAQQLQPILIAHIAEHIALLYRNRMEASVGVSLPPVPDFKSERPDLKDINPELDNLISQRAAQVVQQAPHMQQIAAITVSSIRDRSSEGENASSNTSGSG